MPRGDTLTHPFLETLLFTQRALTIVLSGHNALYFASYRSPRGRRRLGAMVLVGINLAIGAESVAFWFLAQAIVKSGAWLTLGSQLIAASLSLAAVTAMAVLISHHRATRR